MRCFDRGYVQGVLFGVIEFFCLEGLCFGWVWYHVRLKV